MLDSFFGGANTSIENLILAAGLHFTRTGKSSQFANFLTAVFDGHCRLLKQSEFEADKQWYQAIAEYATMALKGH